MKVIFMGTPDFAVESLENLISDARFEVCLVVTQPDRPKGRGGETQPSPVKQSALTHGIEVFQPQKLDDEAVSYISGFSADAVVVAAYGKILPKTLIDMPKYGCINVHASLLPKYRGAAPIQWAIINGDRKSGVTIMRMDEGLDTGDIIMQEEILLARNETGETLFAKLASLGAELLVRSLDAVAGGSATYTPQDELKATKVGMIKKEMGHIDWSLTAAEVERLTRGLYPWPGTFSYIGGDMIKIHRCSVISDDDMLGRTAERTGAEYTREGDDSSVFALGDPGTVACATDRYFAVNTGRGLIALLEVQPAGKKKMKSADFLRGHKVSPGDVLS